MEAVLEHEPHHLQAKEEAHEAEPGHPGAPRQRRHREDHEAHHQAHRDGVEDDRRGDPPQVPLQVLIGCQREARRNARGAACGMPFALT
jgi:hypothetical protein